MRRLPIFFLSLFFLSQVAKGQAYPGFYSELEVYFDQSADRFVKMNVSEMILIAKLRSVNYSNNDSVVIEQDTLARMGIDLDGRWKYVISYTAFSNGDPKTGVTISYDTTYIDCKRKNSCSCNLSKTDTIVCDEKGRLRERKNRISKFSYYYDERDNLTSQICEYRGSAADIISSNHHYSTLNLLDSISYFKWDRTKESGLNTAKLFFTYTKEGDLQNARYYKTEESELVPWRNAHLEYNNGLLTAITYREENEEFTFRLAYKFRGQ